MYDHANTDFMCSIITTDNNTTEQNLAGWVNAVGATYGIIILPDLSKASQSSVNGVTVNI